MMPKRPRVPMATTVRRTEWLTPSVVRIVLGGGDLDRFEMCGFTDAYVKLLFLHPDAAYERPLDLEAVRESMPAEHWPRLRTYTVRAWDAEAVEMTIDVVVHGDEGLAGPWAKRARPGEEVLLLGPGGAYEPDPVAERHLLAGDESALPAIAAAVERLPEGAVADVYIEVHGPADEIPLKAPGATITWLHRGDDPVGSKVVDAVRAEPLTGDVHAFVHGEAGFVKELRRLLLRDWGMPRERLSISGYWRAGVDDEGWRKVKASFDTDQH
jgi:NADPH-dependent ferric siderophore reductase